MSGFDLHPTLARDTIPIADWALSRVVLMNDARFPWLILVPRRPETREVFELSREERAALIEEVARASAALARAVRADKINVGALGNLVPQLHVHVVARKTGDAAWPGPVWGFGQAVPYKTEAQRILVAEFLNAL